MPDPQTSSHEQKTNLKPRLRFVEALPLETENGERFALRDPSGLAEHMFVVSRETLFLLQFFDGRHSLLDMRTEYFRQFGVFLPEQQLQALVAQLDRNYFLESETFHAHKRRLEQEMLALPARPAVHAGASYPAEPGELRRQLDSFYANGAGLPADRGNSGGPFVSGAVAPHIDLRVGGRCYTYTYRALAESAPADVYVILGTGHSGLLHCFSCLPKDFETPLGLVRHDEHFIAELARRHPFDLFSEPLPHRTEHTIEFQAVFLQHLFGGRRHFTIVPILCSYAYLMLSDDRFRHERDIIQAFVRALRQTCELESRRGRRVCCIASVDLSHVGPRYGDRHTPDRDLLQNVETADRQLIHALEAGDAVQFVQANARMQDRYRVCGFAPLHTLLASGVAQYGKLLQYEQGIVDDRKSVVSYASAALYGRG
ncbi:MAG: AmmeMemoRadiSam system protein B [candidate division KSB1 bacterium]|nr:AmmeMemoRadiSam system protein B [candidate division KSB1 bacterium]MDZ7275932.1 AmmeMemoRadiSam system protein B [candidate division KSB1 bacterium]MDZ7285786.1 AmmeMemoRadiSam system protein B [candidate division KSB1 bacterium]MDZ7298818.1 AmmeMemoRadiSam system protein B [candidate division KSB1 bacterium]MDZ7309440.1 AmmeMemoRadiSam system protein B [candidate division KSB1 bacterium]